MLFEDRTTPIGKSIDAYLKGDTQIEDHVIHLLFSANRWEAASRIREDISKGFTLLVDRYYFSGMVYSAAKATPGLDLEWAMQPEVGLPKPDLCFFLHVDPATQMQRRGFGGEKYESAAMQARVKDLFDEVISKEAENVKSVPINAANSLEEVENNILDEVYTCLTELKREEELGSVKAWTVCHE